MPLIECPECGKEFSQYGKECPNCAFPNPLVSNQLATRENHVPQAYSPPQQQPTNQPTQYQPPQRQPTQTVVVEARSEQTTYREERNHDNTPHGFFRGRASFPVALIVYYLGGFFGGYVIAVLLGEAAFLKAAVGAWGFVGMFFVLWNAKNIENVNGKWAVYIGLSLLIVTFLSSALG